MSFDFGKAINDLLPIVAVGGGLYLAYRMLGGKTTSSSGIVSTVGKSLGQSVSEIPAVGENLVESFREGVYGYPFDKILAHEDFVSKGFTLDSLINPENYRIYDAEAQTYQDNLSRLDLIGVLGPLNDNYLFKVTTPSGIETYDGSSGKLIETPTVERATKSSSSSSSSGGSSGGSGYGKATVVDKQTGRVSPDIRSASQGNTWSKLYGN